MEKVARGNFLQRSAGVVTWAAVTGLAIWLAVQNPARYPEVVPVVVVLALVNLAAMLLATAHDRIPPRVRLAAFWLQLAAALAIGWLLPVSFVPILTIVWVAIAPAFYTFRTSGWLLSGVLVAWFGIQYWGWGEQNAIISVVLFGTFHLFALLTAYNAAAAEAARDEVEALNRELLATQHLLAEASRQGERVRIARDLHDLLGHHLTALSINLQIAERSTSGEARDKVEECRALARLLLSDVRDAVGKLRDDRRLDFRSALNKLLDGIPALDIDLDIGEAVVIDDVDVAEALLRCVQETVTNTLRHSGAGRCWIRIREQAGMIVLDVRDDGRAGDDLAEGNGIAGMRERLARLGGHLRLGRADSALSVHVEVPLADAGA